MINVYLDDIRKCPEGFTLARTVDECLLLLETYDVNILSLDHDLGIGELTGTDLVKQMINKRLFPREIYFHTSYFMGMTQMYSLLNQVKPEGTILHHGAMPQSVIDFWKAGKVSFRHVNFTRDKKNILQDINFNIRQGEHWVILGRNGSGKTTLLEILNGYQFPTSGQVSVMGHKLGYYDVRELRKRIGYVGQSLLEKMSLQDPVYEAIATGAHAYLRYYNEIPTAILEKAYSLLEDMQLSTKANQPLGTLSQGERKKILIARALMNDPDLLVLDEPCAGLDLYEREKLLQQINGLNKGNVSLIYVTHQFEEIIPVFTHIALLHQGKIVMADTKQHVLSEEIISQAYELPVHIDWLDERPWVRMGRK